MNDKIEDLQRHDEKLDRLCEKHKNWLMRHDIETSTTKRRVTVAEGKIVECEKDIEYLKMLKAERTEFKAAEKKFALEDIKMTIKIMK